VSPDRTHAISLTVNGERIRRSVPARLSLVDFLREEVGLTGSHVGCEQGVCGACTIIVDGRTARGCLMLAVQADGAEIITVEGLADGGRAPALAEAFLRHNALQCGFCTPGMLVSAVELVEAGGAPIRRHIAGNYCRCTGYQAIVDAIAEVMEKELGP
jgi:aerobic-type carbon monoxide dehydrogenase small subunit (CoxS/CutS family)